MCLFTLLHIIDSHETAHIFYILSTVSSPPHIPGVVKVQQSYLYLAQGFSILFMQSGVPDGICTREAGSSVPARMGTGEARSGIPASICRGRQEVVH